MSRFESRRRHFATMPIAPEPSTSRGEVTLQPSYFTSSLYVDPLRGDLTNLVVLYATQCNQSTQPFELFKKLWTEQGWCWLHMRTFDGRGRQAFLRITKRLFIGTSESPSYANVLTTVIRAIVRQARASRACSCPICAIYLPQHPTYDIRTTNLLREQRRHSYRYVTFDV